MREATPSQTVGPFFGYALPFATGPRLVPEWRTDAIRLHGTVFDGSGAAIPDAIVEIWQTDEAGRVPSRSGTWPRDPAEFTGFGRCDTDRLGHYRFSTLLPGNGFLSVAVFARGLSRHLFTRAYFDDRVDSAFASVDPQRRKTLRANEESPGAYRFDIRLQGENETVFLGV